MKSKYSMRLFIFAMASCLLVASLLVINERLKRVHAADSTTIIHNDGSQTVMSGSGDEIYNIMFPNVKNEIWIIGKHVKSNARYSYETLGFNVSLNKETENGEVPYNNKKQVISILIDEPKNKIEGDTVITTYTIDKAWFYSRVYDLLFYEYGWDNDRIKEQFLREEGVKIYLSNIFCMVERTGGSGTETLKKWGKYQTLNEIMNAPIISGIGAWSAGTQKVLPHYYGMEITLKRTAYELDLEYYDTVNKKIVGKEEKFKTFLTGQTEKIRPAYTKVGDKYQVTLDGKPYNLQNSSLLSYEGYSEQQSFDSFAPDITFEKEANATLRINVEPAETECKVKVQYVNESNQVIQDNIEGGGFNNGEAYSFESYDEKPFINSKAYQYTGKWKYSYTNKSGKKQEKSGTGVPRFTISDAKADSKVLLQLTYKNILVLEKVRTDRIEFLEPNATGVIKADNRGSERFNVTAGIPTTESLYANVIASEYLININVSTITKSIPLPITVTKRYILQWYKTIPRTPEEIRLGIPATKVLMEQTVSVKKVVSVERSYQYTEISSIDYYKINKAALNNSALPNSSVTLTPYSYSVPSLNFQHYETENARLIYPIQVKEGVDLGEEVIPPKGNGRGSIPKENFAKLADEMTDPIQVRNDYLEFDGNIVLDNNYVEEEASSWNKSGVPAPKLIDHTVLYKNNLTIEATKSNGVYSSSGRITYERVAHYKSQMSPSVVYNVSGLNNVIIHTPVYCKATLVNDNSQYVQLVTPDLSCVPIVLDEEGISSDFVIDISNTGYHSFLQGYRERDYSINSKRNASYIAKQNGLLRNEVKFPFDVFIDIGGDRLTENDDFIRAGTWYTVGLNKYRFYVPGYVEEGIYTVDFRTIAVNGTNKSSAVQSNANSSRSYYVATDTVQVQVSGKLFGITLYDIQDYPLWQETFRTYQSTELKRNNLTLVDGTLRGAAYQREQIYYYTLGTRNQFGLEAGRSERFTLPLVEGSHPKYSNLGVLKAGYTWRFTLSTFGNVMMEDASYITVVPKFFYIDKYGNSREEVDLYYTEQIQGKMRTLVKVGGETDKSNTKSTKVRDIFLAIPENELKITARLRNISYVAWSSSVGEMFGYSYIRSNPLFKTFTAVSYGDFLMNSSAGTIIKNNGITQEEITKRKQSYYFEYCIPPNTRAVKKGYDVAGYARRKGVDYSEDFWKKDGYLIINVEITAHDKKGTPYMSYINQENYLSSGHCCMWLMEGAEHSKTDYYGTLFHWKAGDFLMLYTNQTSTDDYIPGGIY